MTLLTMERLQEIVTTTVVFSLTVILLNSSSAIASPIATLSDQFPVDLNCEPPYSVGDGLLRDLMMIASDFDDDNKLSEFEITWFYRHIALYSDYVAQTFGRSFILIADLDHDGLLNPSELLCVLGAMDASDWTRR